MTPEQKKGCGKCIKKPLGTIVPCGGMWGGKTLLCPECQNTRNPGKTQSQPVKYGCKDYPNCNKECEQTADTDFNLKNSLFFALKALRMGEITIDEYIETRDKLDAEFIRRLKEGLWISSEKEGMIKFIDKLSGEIK